MPGRSLDDGVDAGRWSGDPPIRTVPAPASEPGPIGSGPWPPGLIRAGCLVNAHLLRQEYCGVTGVAAPYELLADIPPKDPTGGPVPPGEVPP
ncbi:hypothetical protein Kpho02_69130 [Kitasatospora phosalacinea]|uniref:Uncharacterized protein n=1 Tax=Kitasatospora phosalacinea TaxID=2065 RepID=A0A9W6V6X2_9ACTN|nr:hypothetical protein Kpho02_69130 [Kitasatospora phosalacinea]